MNAVLEAPPAQDLFRLDRGTISRVLRSSHVLKRLMEFEDGVPKWQNARILEIGCGKELEFARILQARHGPSPMYPRHYCAINKDRVNLKDCAHINEAKFNLRVLDCTTMDDVHLHEMTETFNGSIKTRRFSHILSLNPDTTQSCLNHLAKCKEFLLPDGRMFFSQRFIQVEGSLPGFKRHIEGVTDTLRQGGFTVLGVYGQHARNADVYADLPDNDDTMRLWNKLEAYYDIEMLACIFAPLFPEISSICLFECGHTP